MRIRPQRLPQQLECGTRAIFANLKRARGDPQNVLLPNGDVALCCMDWSAKYVLGNLKHDRFEDLYRSETFRHVLRGLKDPSVDLLCRTCHVAQSGAVKDRLKTAIYNTPAIGPIAVQTLSRLKRGRRLWGTSP